MTLTHLYTAIILCGLKLGQLFINNVQLHYDAFDTQAVHINDNWPLVVYSVCLSCQSMSVSICCCCSWWWWWW